MNSWRREHGSCIWIKFTEIFLYLYMCFRCIYIYISQKCVSVRLPLFKMCVEPAAASHTNKNSSSTKTHSIPSSTGFHLTCEEYNMYIYIYICMAEKPHLIFGLCKVPPKTFSNRVLAGWIRLWISTEFIHFYIPRKDNISLADTQNLASTGGIWWGYALCFWHSIAHGDFLREVMIWVRIKCGLYW